MRKPVRSTGRPVARLATATLLGALGTWGLVGCQNTSRLSAAQLRESLLAEHRAKLEGRAEVVRLERGASEFETSLERILEKAKADGVQLPEGRRSVADNLKAADAMSGPGSYSDTPLNVGSDLLDSDQTPTVVLDLKSAVRKAIEHNLDLAVARMNPQISAQQIIQAEAVFDTVLFAGGEWADVDTPRPGGGFAAFTNDQQAETLNLRTGIRQGFEYGTQVTAQAQLDRTWQQPTLAGFPPRYYNADLSLAISQPLLRGFGRDVNRANIELAGILQQSDLANLETSMLDLARSVEQAYWQLVVARRALLIQQTLHERTIQMRDKLEPRFGFDLLLADLNEVNARVDQRYADVIRARQNVRALSDRLKRLINDPDLSVIDETVLEPADSPADVALSFSLLDQVTTALKYRPEIKSALLAINDADVRRVVADNAQLPILNLTASTRTRGLDVDDPFDALGATTDLDYIDYAIGLEFERPWGNRSGRALFEQRTLERQRALKAYRSTAQAVTLEVKDALRSVDTNYRLIATTRSQRRASSLSLEVAEIQLERGGRNEAETFTTRVDRVLARQDALAQAQLAEVQALSDYMVAISELRRATGTSLEEAGLEVDENDER